MLYQAKNGILQFGDSTMEYIRFGRGERVLVMLPGLGDGLRTMKGTALPMAVMYRKFAKDFTVYAFSRKNPLPQGHTTRAMAADQARAMELLGIEKADVFGVSMGGMIAQWLAIDHPEKVGKLILAVTSGRPNPILRESVEEWVSLARKGDHSGFMESNLRRIYSEKYYRKNKWLAPIVGRLTKPKSYDRFSSRRRLASATMPVSICPVSGHLFWSWAVSRIKPWGESPPGRLLPGSPARSFICTPSGATGCTRKRRT